MEDIKLMQGDCLELMKQIPDNSVDLLVTDCPYKIVAGGCSGARKDNCGGIFRKVSSRWVKKGQDDVADVKRNGKLFKHNDILFSAWLPEVYRVLKPGTHCYIFISGRHIMELQTEAEKAGFQFVNLLAWRKQNKTPNRYYMKQLEFILLLRKGRARSINNMGTGNCLDVPNIIGKKNHPTEKPVELMQILVENSSQPGETVLDPFMGTGATGVACVATGRKFIGMELDQDYFQIAKRRMGHG